MELAEEASFVVCNDVHNLVFLDYVWKDFWGSNAHSLLMERDGQALLLCNMFGVKGLCDIHLPLNSWNNGDAVCKVYSRHREN